MTRVRIYRYTTGIESTQIWSGWFDAGEFTPDVPQLDSQSMSNLVWHLGERRPTALIDEDVFFTADPMPTARELLGLPEGDITREDVQLGLSLSVSRHERAAVELLQLIPTDDIRDNPDLDAIFA